MSHAIKNLREKKMKDVKTRLKAPRKREMKGSLIRGIQQSKCENIMKNESSIKRCHHDL